MPADAFLPAAVGEKDGAAFFGLLAEGLLAEGLLVGRTEGALAAGDAFAALATPTLSVLVLVCAAEPETARVTEGRWGMSASE